MSDNVSDGEKKRPRAKLEGAPGTRPYWRKMQTKDRKRAMRLLREGWEEDPAFYPMSALKYASKIGYWWLRKHFYQDGVRNTEVAAANATVYEENLLSLDGLTQRQEAAANVGEGVYDPRDTARDISDTWDDAEAAPYDETVKPPLGAGEYTMKASSDTLTGDDFATGDGDAADDADWDSYGWTRGPQERRAHLEGLSLQQAIKQYDLETRYLATLPTTAAA